MQVPLRVSWSTMMLAKIRGALRLSRLVLMGVAVLLLAIGLGPLLNIDLCTMTTLALVGLVGLRLVVMGLSAVLDRDARRFDGAVLDLETMQLRFPDGGTRVLPDAWVLESDLRAGVLALRVAERGGRMWLFLSTDQWTDAQHEALRARLP